MDGYSHICDRCGARHELEPVEDEGGLYDLCQNCRAAIYGKELSSDASARNARGVLFAVEHEDVGPHQSLDGREL